MENSNTTPNISNQISHHESHIPKKTYKTHYFYKSYKISLYFKLNYHHFR